VADLIKFGGDDGTAKFSIFTLVDQNGEALVDQNGESLVGQTNG